MKKFLLSFVCLFGLGLTGVYASDTTISGSITYESTDVSLSSSDWKTYSFINDATIGWSYSTAQDYSANESVIILAYTVNGSADNFSLKVQYYVSEEIDEDYDTTAEPKVIGEYENGDDVVTVMLFRARLDKTYKSSVANIAISGNAGSNIVIQKSGLDAKADYDLSVGDAEIPSEGGTYRITGDGSASGNTIIIPSDGKSYTIYLDGVTIDTTNRPVSSGSKQNRASSYFELTTATVNNSGIYIPENAKVTIYLMDENSVKGSTYGIYAGSNATWELRPLGNSLSSIWLSGATSSLVSYTVDTVTSAIDIEGGDYGIANEGGYLEIQGYNVTNGYDSPSYDGNDYLGKINITADICGIYSRNGLKIDDVTMTITVEGDGEVEVNENPTTSEDEPGYTINKLVCGIYVENSSGQTNALNVAVTYLTIVASGEHTYGVFLDNGASGYFGYGYFNITATQCCLHHEGMYNGYGHYGDDYSKTFFAFHGPFCSHYVHDEYNGDWYWYCDGAGYGKDSITGSFEGAGTTYTIYDEDATTTGYNRNYALTYSEVQYVDRTLKTGWNTICLPFRYDLNPDDDNYESDLYVSEFYGVADTEARDVISKYACLSEITNFEDSNDAVITFTAYDSTVQTDGKDVILEANQAYLVYLDPETVTDVDENGGVLVSFTAIQNANNGSTADNGDNSHLVQLVEVKDHYRGSLDEPLITVFHPEELTHDQAVEKNYYKIIRREENGEVKNYFNQPDIMTVVAAYRALIDVSGTDAAGAKNISLLTIDAGDDETPTGIRLVENVSISTGGDVDIYSINGQLLKTVPTGSNVTKGLPKGVYIIDGKKVAVM